VEVNENVSLFNWPVFLFCFFVVVFGLILEKKARTSLQVVAHTATPSTLGLVSSRELPPHR